MAGRSGYLRMNPFDFHKHLINNYVLTRKGATKLLQRDASRDKRDADVIRENHKFLWDEDDEPQTWEERLAKKYYDKLFKEFCITDLSRYKENMVKWLIQFAMRWQTEQELVVGKGQFVCGNKCCSQSEGLRTWEVNFAYKEHGQKKNALVKLRLCDKCSAKLNYRHKKKEIKRLRHAENTKTDDRAERSSSTLTDDLGAPDASKDDAPPNQETSEDTDVWSKPLDIEQPSRDEEFEKYLEHLLL